jgi:hypothetical protein
MSPQPGWPPVMSYRNDSGSPIQFLASHGTMLLVLASMPTIGLPAAADASGLIERRVSTIVGLVFGSRGAAPRVARTTDGRLPA